MKLEKENECGIKPILGNITEERKDLYDIGKEIYRMILKEKGKKDDEMINNINEKCNDDELKDLMGKLLVENNNKYIFKFFFEFIFNTNTINISINIKSIIFY